MKVDQFFSKYKENITLVILGGCYFILASFSFLSAKFNKIISEKYNIDDGSPFNTFQKNMLLENEALVDKYMPYLFAIGLSWIVLGLVYKKIKSLILPLFIILSSILVYWIVKFNQGTIQIMENMQQFIEASNLTDQMPSIFTTFMKAAQNQSYVSNYLIYLSPLIIAGGFLFWFFPKNQKAKPTLPPFKGTIK